MLYKSLIAALFLASATQIVQAADRPLHTTLGTKDLAKTTQATTGVTPLAGVIKTLSDFGASSACTPTPPLPLGQSHDNIAKAFDVLTNISKQCNANQPCIFSIENVPDADVSHVIGATACLMEYWHYLSKLQPPSIRLAASSVFPAVLAFINRRKAMVEINSNKMERYLYRDLLNENETIKSFPDIPAYWESGMGLLYVLAGCTDANGETKKCTSDAKFPYTLEEVDQSTVANWSTFRRLSMNEHLKWLRHFFRVRGDALEYLKGRNDQPLVEDTLKSAMKKHMKNFLNMQPKKDDPAQLDQNARDWLVEQSSPHFEYEKPLPGGRMPLGTTERMKAIPWEKIGEHMSLKPAGRAASASKGIMGDKTTDAYAELEKLKALPGATQKIVDALPLDSRFLHKDIIHGQILRSILNWGKGPDDYQRLLNLGLSSKTPLEITSEDVRDHYNALTNFFLSHTDDTDSLGINPIYKLFIVPTDFLYPLAELLGDAKMVFNSFPEKVDEKTNRRTKVVKYVASKSHSARTPEQHARFFQLLHDYVEYEGELLEQMKDWCRKNDVPNGEHVKLVKTLKDYKVC